MQLIDYTILMTKSSSWPQEIICRHSNDGDPILLRLIKTKTDEASCNVSLEELELALTKRLCFDGDVDEVEYFPRFDAHWLKCLTMAPVQSIQTILGIMEDDNHLLEAQQQQQERSHCGNGDYSSATTILEIIRYEALLPTEVSDSNDWPRYKDRHEGGPRRSWLRNPLTSSPSSSLPTKLSKSLLWIDLRRAQQHENEADRPIFSTQIGVVHFLRSILTSSQDVSPWTKNLGVDSDAESDQPDIIVLVFCGNESIPILEGFRVSDVAPSWLLHARAYLDDLESPHELLQSIPKNDGVNDKAGATAKVVHPRCFDDASSPATLLIFKKLGPRPLLSANPPQADILSNKPVQDGFLWETIPTEKENDVAGTKDKDTSDNEVDPEQHLSPIYRPICPPYLDLQSEYPNTKIAELFTQESIQILTMDALSIPSWIAWPESVHYGKKGQNGDTIIPWTVFPLCHCFPADQPEQLTWIPTTRSHVPQTCALLERLVGQKYLRTALFSQLAPHSVLEAHTGWADLANHVLRLHIPLIVPGEEDGLCGTWVDGCIETHGVGRPLLFDDSKIHRAFNYSDETRIVLIVDLARPSHLPPGYATGGHSEELDAFIKQMSRPR